MKTPDLITDTVAPLGPNARAMLEGRRTAPGCYWDAEYDVCNRCGVSRGGHRGDREIVGACLRFEAPNARAMLEERRNCAHQFGGVGVCVRCGTSAYRQPSPRPTVANLIADIAAGIRVLNERGMCIPEELIQERTANIVQGLLGNYTITGTGE